MLKRARRTWTTPGTTAEDLLHRCIVATDHLILRTWYRQGEGVNRPGDGNAGDNLLGEDLDERLTGMLLTPVGELVVPWNATTMQGGSVHYVSPLFDGSPAPTGYDMMELDDMAALATASQRQAALYHHWDHKQYVFIFGFISRIFDTTGIGLIPALKIITDGQPANFLDDGVIIEARLGPLGFIGDFDHTKPANDVTYRDIRETLPNGDPNPAFGRFSIPPAMPQGWEFG